MTAVSQTDTDDSTRGRRARGAAACSSLVMLILFQMLCTAFFVYDVIMDFREGEGTVLHLMPEWRRRWALWWGWSSRGGR